jgi:DNA-binding response OmpR family regulator
MPTKTILVVNDEADLNVTIRKVLEDKGFKVDSYEDAHLALENFKLQYYDRVLVDYKMPQMNGFTFYRGVKAIDPNVKTCFLTAADVQPDQYSHDTFSCPLPPNYFIRIPIENKILLERIEEIMAEVK